MTTFKCPLNDVSASKNSFMKMSGERLGLLNIASLSGCHCRNQFITEKKVFAGVNESFYFVSVGCVLTQKRFMSEKCFHKAVCEF